MIMKVADSEDVKNPVREQGILDSEVMRHNTPQDCWVIIHNKVYDMTNFLAAHPGGQGIIMKYAGKDATAAFSSVHNADMISPELLPNDVVFKGLAVSATGAKQIQIMQKQPYRGRPHIGRILNTFDLESVGRHNCGREAWGYLNSGGDDEISFRENTKAFHRIWLRPRVLRNVANIDPSITAFGEKLNLPFYVSATALGKLYDPEGEVAITKALGDLGVAQMCPTLASSTMEEMAQARSPGQTQWYQLYVNPDRKITEAVIRKAENLGYKALFVTVDAPGFGRRERDMRNKAVMISAVQSDNQKTMGSANQGTAKALGAFIDKSLCWNDIPWLLSVTKLPVMLKGIQTAQDALLAYHSGVHGIVVSNHGGRQLDHSRSGVECLLEISDALKADNCDFSKFHLFVDGGVRRGTDVLKCIAVGARAVGVGRSFIYGLAAYGPAGVRKCAEILGDELETCMRLIGATKTDQIKRDMIITKDLDNHASTVMEGLHDTNYEPMTNVVDYLQRERDLLARSHKSKL